MNKFFTNLKSLMYALLVAALMTSSMVSCSYDDSDLRNEIDQIKQDLAQLRIDLQGEIDALKSIVNGMVTVTDVNENSDGSTVVTLSDGTSFTIYPKGDEIPKNIITVINDNGTLYWAMYNSEGKAEAILINGNKVLVGGVTPEIRENTKDGTIEVSFDGGNTWTVTGYSPNNVEPIIKDVNVVYSDWQTDNNGNPVALYCEFILADGTVIKVGMQGSRLVMTTDTVYVPFGTEREFFITANGAADYMLEKPAGWGCDVTFDKNDQSYYLNFVSPSYEDVMSGVAEANGIVKLMVVFDDGMSAIARINLSTEPAIIRFLPEGVSFEAGYGCDYIMFGMLPASVYKPETVVNMTTQVINGQSIERVKEIGFFETTSAFIPYNEVYSSTMDAGAEFIFWFVVPRYDSNGNLSVSINDIATRNYKHNEVKFNVVEVGFFDAEIEFSAKGTNGYVYGFCQSNEFDATYIAESYSGSYFDYYVVEDRSYTGSFLDMFDAIGQTLNPGVEYTAWCITRNDSNEYSADDVRNWTFTTRDFEMGGTLAIEEVAVETNYTTLDVTLDSAGHITMYYKILPYYEASAYPTDELSIDMLRREGTMSISDKAAVAHYIGKSAGEKVTLFAVAVDGDGKFGKVFKKEYTTKVIKYNNIDVAMSLVSDKCNNIRIQINGAGAQKFIYIVCGTTDSEWTSRYGGSVTQAGYYIATNPNGEGTRHTDTAEYALQDGCIVMTDLISDKEYVVVAMAIDSEGGFSKPEAIYFTPLPDIGEVVYASDPKWAEGKPEVTIGTTMNIEFFSFAWYVSPVEGYTAYTIAEFPSNFTDHMGIDTPEKLISYIKTHGQKCEYSDNYSRKWWEYVWDESKGTYVEEWFEEDNLPGVYNFYYYGTEDVTQIYTTWCDPDGNFHEAFIVNPAE